jgi:hypothetical protein
MLAAAELLSLSGRDVQVDDREVQVGVAVARFFLDVLEVELAEFWLQPSLGEAMRRYSTTRTSLITILALFYVFALFALARGRGSRGERSLRASQCWSGSI